MLDGNPPTNVARSKPLTSASGVTITNPLYATDGNKTVNNYATIGSGLKYAQLDLGSAQNIEKVKLWHYSPDGRKYHDVIIQFSNDATFATGVTTVFNNDDNNTAGFGAGPDDEYDESAEGKEFVFNPVYARYIRVWSNGSTVNTNNYITELEVYPSNLPMTYYYDAWGNQKDFNEVNGDFETDSDANGKDDNWSFANIAITSLSATTVKFGKKSQKIATTSIAADAAVYKNYTTKAGHKYLLTGYCYVVSKADKLSTRANNQGNYWNTTLGNTYWPDTLNQWYQTGVVFTATSDATTIVPCFINKQLCEVYLDGWKLIDLTEMYGAGNEPLTLTDAIKTVNNSITYAGYQYDKETGLYYLNARFYDATTARFMQEDTYTGSIDDPLSLNLYSYCHNEPIMYIDPTGHKEGDWWDYRTYVSGAKKAGKAVVDTVSDGAEWVADKASDGYNTYVAPKVNTAKKWVNSNVVTPAKGVVKKTGEVINYAKQHPPKNPKDFVAIGTGVAVTTIKNNIYEPLFIDLPTVVGTLTKIPNVMEYRQTMFEKEAALESKLTGLFGIENNEYYYAAGALTSIVDAARGAASVAAGGYLFAQGSVLTGVGVGGSGPSGGLTLVGAAAGVGEMGAGLAIGAHGVSSIHSAYGNFNKNYDKFHQMAGDVSSRGVNKTADGAILEITSQNQINKKILETKPKMSKDPKKWINKGGKITIDKNGTWTYHDWEGNSVSYPDGYPDFKSAGMVEQEVPIGKFEGYNKDFSKADELAPNGPKAESSTWHHHQDGTTMQEINAKLHARFTHIGGMSKVK